jgi:predicted nucleic acid-binding protein
VIIDTNILIYLSKYILSPQDIITQNSAISIITKIESLGFGFKNPEEHNLLSAICNELKIIPLSDNIAEETIRLRTKYKIKLPDAIIYVTSVVEGLPLLTNNTADFKLLDGKVKLINPFST